MLASAFDHLNGDEKQVGSFMLKNDKLHRQWLQNFFDNYLNQFDYIGAFLLELGHFYLDNLAFWYLSNYLF